MVGRGMQSGAQLADVRDALRKLIGKNILTDTQVIVAMSATGRNKILCVACVSEGALCCCDIRFA